MKQDENPDSSDTREIVSDLLIATGALLSAIGKLIRKSR